MKVRQFALRRPPTSSQGLVRCRSHQAFREEVTRLLTVLEPLPLRVQPQSWGNLRRGWAPPPRSTLFAEAIKVGHKVNLPGEGRVQRLPIHRIAPCIYQHGCLVSLTLLSGSSLSDCLGAGSPSRRTIQPGHQRRAVVSVQQGWPMPFEPPPHPPSHLFWDGRSLLKTCRVLASLDLLVRPST
ncbi:hypothetical protein J6590_082380 [Homalodisca vitripennis]|nr:hypothetical protein J6590_082380 [Homalodisca vitripennis]